MTVGKVELEDIRGALAVRGSAVPDPSGTAGKTLVNIQVTDPLVQSGNSAVGDVGMARVTVLQGSSSETPAEARELNGLFRRVAQIEGWEHGGDLDFPSQYHPFSTYFALYSQGRLVGGLHLVRGNPAGRLPTCEVWPEMNERRFAARTDVADAYLLTLSPEVRGRAAMNAEGTCPLFWMLCTTLWRWCAVEGITELCGIATPRNVVLYRRLGWPLQVVGPERLHWGETCVSFVADVAQAVAEVARRADKGSQTYREILRVAVAETTTNKND